LEARFISLGNSFVANIGSYEERIKELNWSLPEKELDYFKGDTINIGWYCSDRISLKGSPNKIALYYESLGGIEKKYTFNDIRLACNTFGAFFINLGVNNEDRICLFMDQMSEQYS
jgi:acetyl-CoA synthetase